MPKPDLATPPPKGKTWYSFETHLPVLTSMLFAVRGKQGVLELGTGTASTPVLHALCAARKMFLVSLEQNPEWVEDAVKFRTPGHEVIPVADWDAALAKLTGPWDLVFVDHAPGAHRIKAIQTLRKTARFLVVHDTENPGYGWAQVFPSFPYKLQVIVEGTGTTVLSDTEKIPVKELFRT